MEDHKSSRLYTIPVGRVNTIMKSSSDVENVSKESSVIMSKAAEIFINTLTKEGYKMSKDAKRLDYKHLASVVHQDEKYNFLRDILPQKITVLQFKEIMAKKKALEEKGSGNEDSSDEGESSSCDGQDSGSES